MTRWLLKHTAIQSVLYVSRLLCIIGGLTILVSGVVFFALSQLALGLVTAIVSGQVRHLLWSSVMVFLGVLAYYFVGRGFPWGLGPLLVISGGVTALSTIFSRRSRVARQKPPGPIP